MASPTAMQPATVVSFTGDSGLTDYSAALCGALSAVVQVQLVTARSFDANAYQPSYPVITLFRRTRHFLLDFPRLVARLWRQPPPQVLLQSWLKWPLLELPWVLAMRWHGVRMYLTIHDLLPHYPRPWSRLLLRWYYRAFDGLIVHSDQQASGLRAMGVLRPTLTVPHGVYDIFNTLRLSRSEARVRLPVLHAAAFVVLFFGHLDERKGIAAFVQAAELLQSDDRFQFVIAGKSDGRPGTEAALRTARQLANTVVHDHKIAHADVQLYFAGCDAVALPYLEGTTSGVMKLAMAFSRPVVCTDVGDFPESLAAWVGVPIEGRQLPHSLVQGLRVARAHAADHQQRAQQQSADLAWPRIAQRYAAFMGLRPPRADGA